MASEQLVRGRPMGAVRYRTVRYAFGAGAVVLSIGVLVLASGWPYWREHQALAGIEVTMTAALTVSGLLLAAGRRSRPTGLLFVVTAILQGITWCAAWNRGYFPWISESAQSIFFFALGIGCLLYGQRRFASWREWAWTVEAVILLLGGQAVLFLTCSAATLGYSAQAHWPTLDVPPAEA